MKYYRRLYVGESIQNVKNVKFKLAVGAGQFQVWLIALAKNSDQLDIFHCAELKQKCYDKKNLCVVCLAGSKDEAFQLVGKMLADTLAAGMEGDIKGYLVKNFEKTKGGGG